MAEKGIVLGPEGPACASCGGILPADGMEVLLQAVIYAAATVGPDGVLSFDDPRTHGNFEWEIVEAECPVCGHGLRKGADRG